MHTFDRNTITIDSESVFTIYKSFIYLIPVFVPLIGSFVAGLTSPLWGAKSAARFSAFGIRIAFSVSTYIFYENLFSYCPSYMIAGNWISGYNVKMPWGFLFDSLTASRLIVITSISRCVHIYSREYRAHDPHLPRFRSYLSLFTFFRLILVTANNFIQRFVGWEGVGLCSYLLINFWFGRIQANKSAIKARILNRIGDLGISIARITLCSIFGCLDYAVIFALIDNVIDKTIVGFSFEIPFADFVAFFLFVGAVGKSAQVGLHTWLPDAREGPTPVSALIHAATRVTAGVFLLCRCSPILQYAYNRNFYITIVGGRTAFLAATVGLLQTDIKRVIAYSTCSQLGYRIFAVGLTGYHAARLHLVNHAFFKALLFLGAGSVIHARADEQDRRKRGGLRRLLPLTYTSRLVGSLALSGFPFLAGFYSKDLILEVAASANEDSGFFVYVLGTLSAFFTAFYSRRLLYFIFLRPANGYRVSYEHAHEPSYFRSFPLVFLSFVSMFCGYFFRDIRALGGLDFWRNTLRRLPNTLKVIDAEFVSTQLKLTPLVFALTGLFRGIALYSKTSGDVGFKLLYSFKLGYIGRTLYTFLNRKWFFDKVYNEIISSGAQAFAYTNAYQNRDRGVFETFGPYGIATQVYSRSASLKTIPEDFLFSKLIRRFAFLRLVFFILVFWTQLYSFANLATLALRVTLYTFFH